MTSQLNAYLSFNGDAREAMERYSEIFGGELEVTTFAEFGVGGPDLADNIMHATMTGAKGFVLMGSDTPPGMTYSTTGNVQLILSGADEAELRGYWEALSAGGEVESPLESQVWGDIYGRCIDRFGITWMVNISVG